MSSIVESDTGGASCRTLKGSARPYAVLRAAFQALSSLLSLAALLLPAVAAAECASAPPIIGGDQKCVETLTVVAFGDSLTAGSLLPASQAFPAQLERRLAADGFPVRVVNAGVSGDTTADGLARLDYALAEKPDLVILELGANDMLRGVDPKATRENLEKMLAAIKEKGAAILFAGMKASGNYGDAYRAQFDAIYPGLASALSLPLYPFFLDGLEKDAVFLQKDGLHPTAEGVARIVAGVAPAVEESLREIMIERAKKAH
jgi:acyl-CoA thioesterase I